MWQNETQPWTIKSVTWCYKVIYYFPIIIVKQTILDVFESTIGKYIKYLDSESLNVALWNGQIELNSLELKIVAVNAELERQATEAPNLSLPFRVTSGRFAGTWIGNCSGGMSSSRTTTSSSQRNIQFQHQHQRAQYPCHLIGSCLLQLVLWQGSRCL